MDEVVSIAVMPSPVREPDKEPMSIPKWLTNVMMMRGSTMPDTYVSEDRRKVNVILITG
jgi:hypothetical protein